MRITLRNKNNKDYWEKRWDSIETDEAMENPSKYPLKYTNETLKKNETKNPKILEAGCGAGRIVKYLEKNNYDVTGIDFIDTAIKKIKISNPTFKVFTEDIKKTSFQNNQFDVILSFGLYHNFDLENVKSALKETLRILNKNGLLCFSFRMDNIQNYILDNFIKKKKIKEENLNFHKLNLTEQELINLINEMNLNILSKSYVVNMPLLFHFKIFRSNDQKEFNEHLGRKKGYSLNMIGKFLNWILTKFFSKYYSNVAVFICRKE